MKHKTGMLLILAGVGLNLLDDFTGTATASGIVYGPTGFLAGINNKLPAGLVVGDTLAGIGVVLLWMHHGL